MVEGIFQNQAEVDASGQPNARVGGLKYANLDGKDGITADDQDWIYNPVPVFSYGLNVALNYKGFDFSMFWQGVYDKDIYNNQNSRLISGVLQMPVQIREAVFWVRGQQIIQVPAFRL